MDVGLDTSIELRQILKIIVGGMHCPPAQEPEECRLLGMNVDNLLNDGHGFGHPFILTESRAPARPSNNISSKKSRFLLAGIDCSRWAKLTRPGQLPASAQGPDEIECKRVLWARQRLPGTF